jgi:nicotinamide mononucleotide (NMN) deamidase PncC
VVKFDLLDVDPGPVLTARAAEQMATGVRTLIRAEIGVSTTGVAGPDTEEGQPVGTLFVGIATPGTFAATNSTSEAARIGSGPEAASGADSSDELAVRPA